MNVQLNKVTSNLYQSKGKMLINQYYLESKRNFDFCNTTSFVIIWPYKTNLDSYNENEWVPWYLVQ